MFTASALTVSPPSALGVSAPGGVCSWGGVYSWEGGVCSGGCLLQGGVCSRGVSAPRGGLLPGGLFPGGIPACTEADTPPVNRITNACENIYLAPTSLRAVNIIATRISNSLFSGIWPLEKIDY